MKKRWVVKVGSQMVASGGLLLMRSWMDQVLKLKRKHDIEIIWVSSGAISSAVHRTNFKKTKTDWTIHEKQALSAVGQPILMDLYNLALQATGLLGAQVLLTNDDFINRGRRKNLMATLNQLLKWNVVPILNENDAVATEEIKFGDNDTLSAKVAVAMNADKLVILTDVEGLYQKNPKVHKDAKLLSRVEKISKSIVRLADAKTGSRHGTGGMLSKIKAAQQATKGHVETFLVKGDLSDVLLKVAEGEAPGTLFEAK